MKHWSQPFILILLAGWAGLTGCKPSGGADADNAIKVGEFASLTGKEAWKT
jgi:hypothetical protein